MTYKVLSLKWRPQSFNDIVGQVHVTQTLTNAIKQDRIAQAYLFTGPRGVGKTTTARILAMALNANKKPSVNFDPNSIISREIAESRSIDVLEIDGASNRGIDEIRNLREQIKFAPMNATFKVIIIDEVHMLTNQAFNALLRTLEEPPEHGKFIFATTDIHKVPATIISRCQRFDFNNISLNVIAQRLKYIMESEELKFDQNAINAIAKKARGSMRDALSMLDQTIAFCSDNFNYNNVIKAIGVIENELFFQFTDCIKNKDYNGMILVLSHFNKTGIPASEILVGIQEHIRNLIYAGFKNKDLFFDLNQETIQLYFDQSSDWEKKDLLYISQVFTDIIDPIRSSDDPHILLEMTSLKLLEMDQVLKIDKLLSKLRPLMHYNIANNDTNNNTLKNENNFLKDPKKESLSVKNNDNNVENANIRKNSSISEQTQSDLKFNIETIQSVWSSVIEKINLNRPSIGAIMEDYFPITLENNDIIFESKVEQGYNEKMVQDGKKFVEKELSSLFHFSIKSIFNKSTVNNKISNEKDDSENNTETKTDDNVFNKVVDLFDGEIIR